MTSCLISDAPYAPWLSEVLATLEEHKIDRITVAAPLADGEVFTGYYNMNTQDKALWDAVLALLHDRIYTECYRFMELGYITRDGLRNLNYLYKTYHVMGGNGTGTELYKRACALPIHN